MPIEIREVVIKTTTLSQINNPYLEEVKKLKEELRRLKREIIEECIQEILEEIDTNSER